jgi:hypothetical protein
MQGTTDYPPARLTITALSEQPISQWLFRNSDIWVSCHLSSSTVRVISAHAVSPFDYYLLVLHVCWLSLWQAGGSPHNTDLRFALYRSEISVVKGIWECKNNQPNIEWSSTQCTQGFAALYASFLSMSTDHDIALFKEKQKYMYTISDKNLLTDQGISILASVLS